MWRRDALFFRTHSGVTQARSFHVTYLTRVPLTVPLRFPSTSLGRMVIFISPEPFSQCFHTYCQVVPDSFQWESPCFAQTLIFPPSPQSLLVNLVYSFFSCRMNFFLRSCCAIPYHFASVPFLHPNPYPLPSRLPGSPVSWMSVTFFHRICIAHINL